MAKSRKPKQTLSPLLIGTLIAALIEIAAVIVVLGLIFGFHCGRDDCELGAIAILLFYGPVVLLSAMVASWAFLYKRGMKRDPAIYSVLLSVVPVALLFKFTVFAIMYLSRAIHMLRGL